MGRTRAWGWAGFWFKRVWDLGAKEHKDLLSCTVLEEDEWTSEDWYTKHTVQGAWLHPNTSTEDFHLYVQVIQPGFVASSPCHPGVYLSVLLLVLSSFSHWRTVRIFLLAPNCLSVADWRVWYGAFHPSCPCIPLLISFPRVTQRCHSLAYCV